MVQLDIVAVRNAIDQNRYLITTHAKQRMGQRHVSDQDVKYVIATGEMIEEYPSARPFPKALFMAQLNGEPLYVVAAFDGTYAYIITVHWYDPSVWVDPRTRRRD
jgi:hypothetical protein